MARQPSSPEPPINVPRIVDVIQPGDTNHHIVMVRMPTQLKGRFPSVPWGTSIADIGLAKKDSDRFPNYVYVDTESIKNTQDLLWIFQKLDGPIWTTKTNKKDGLVPQKYSEFIQIIETKQEVSPGTEPDALTGNIVFSTVAERENTGIAVKINKEEVLQVGVGELIGELKDTWGINTTAESLVVEGTSTEGGYGVKESFVRPLGNGLSIKFVERYPDDGGDGIVETLNEQEHDEVTGIVFDIKKSLVDAASAETIADTDRAAGWYTEVKGLDIWHSITISTKIDATTIPDAETWEETGNISLPSVLEEAGVYWNSSQQSNYSASGLENLDQIVAKEASWTLGASASANANVTGTPYTKVTDGIKGNALVSITRTYHYGPPVTTITARKFNPVRGVIRIYSESTKATMSSRAGGTGGLQYTAGGGTGGGYNLQRGLLNIGPVEYNNGLTLTEINSSILTVQSNAGAGSSPPSGGVLPGATAIAVATGYAALELPPSTQPLSSGDQYVVKVDVSKWRFGWWIRDVYTITVP
jgi:hypothetical protein